MRRLREFWSEKAGVSTTEFALVSLVFFLFVFMTIDFGRALWEWNSAAKATQWGARYAIVNDMVPTGLQTFDGLQFVGQGQQVPIAVVNPNPVICTNAGCNGYGPKSDPAFDAIVAEVQKIFRRVQPDNVVVEYEHYGPCFAGWPGASDICPAVTVRLQGMTFDLLMGGLIGLPSLNMPEFATTLTGEDNAS